jgi:hypothetical protein
MIGYGWGMFASQCWLLALKANIHIRIFPQTFVFALKYPYFPPNSTSGVVWYVDVLILSKNIYIYIKQFFVVFYIGYRTNRCDEKQ